MTYKVVKRYGHELGLSCAFRQWRAQSHCSFVHGYPLAFEFEVHAHTLDERNWVMDYGSFKPIKDWLVDSFDHKTLVAEDDPQLETFKQLHLLKIVDLRIAANVGCEAFAEMAYGQAAYHITHTYNAIHGTKVRLREVRVWEHSGNMAAYSPWNSAGL